MTTGKSGKGNRRQFERGATVNTLTYGFDAAGNQTSASGTHNGAYTFTYDALDRVAVQQGPWGLTLTNNYDPVGNRTLVQDSLGGTTSYSYDDADRLTQVQYSSTGAAATAVGPENSIRWSDGHGSPGGGGKPQVE